MIRAVVPCNGCTACCRHDLIMLHPEHGDRVDDYLTVPAVNPITGQPGHAIRRKSDDSCIYLGDAGCTIHDRAPAICRTFDCRRVYAETPRARRRQAVSIGIASKAVFEAGRARLHTLEELA